MQQGKRPPIVRAAFDAFAEHGFRVSLDEIAKRASVSKVAIYGHFTDKEELFRTVITERLQEAVAAARALQMLEAEAKRFPEDTGPWLDRVPAELRLVLEYTSRVLPDTVGIRLPDPGVAASQLYALCVQPGAGRLARTWGEDVIGSGAAMFVKCYEIR